MNIFGSHHTTRDIVVVGTSAGGIEVLMDLLAQLPEDFPAAVFIVIHIPPEYPSKLPQILARCSILPVIHPSDNEKIKKGYVYVAPPDNHLIIEGENIRLSRGPKENHFRPAIDVLFRSAAWSCGSRVSGVVLTGVLDDGSAGLFAIKSRGGKTVVQDPNEALYADMPRNAMKAVEVDHCVSVKEMGGLLGNMVKESVEEEGNPASEQMELEVKIALEDNAFEKGAIELGEFTPYTCPECHGALVQIKEKKLTRFRCHTGHAFSLNTLLVEVTKSIDNSLWSTLRTIEESQLLMNHIASHLQEAEQNDTADLVLQKADEAQERAKAVRKLVMNNEILSQEKLSGNAKGQS